METLNCKEKQREENCNSDPYLIEPDSFTGLNNLRRLNFTRNNLWTVPPGTFCGLKSLTSLNLSSNFLQDLSDLGFGISGPGGSMERPCPALPLTTLDVSLNGLSKMVAGALGQLSNLKSLFLEGNTLAVLDDSAFQVGSQDFVPCLLFHG